MNKNIIQDPEVQNLEHMKENKENMKPFIMLMIILMPAVILLSLLVQMFVANQSIIFGDQLRRIENRIAEVTEQNEYLNQQLAALSSISRIEREARKLGLHEVTSYMAYDADVLKVALKR